MGIPGSLAVIEAESDVADGNETGKFTLSASLSVNLILFVIAAACRSRWIFALCAIFQLYCCASPL